VNDVSIDYASATRLIHLSSFVGSSPLEAQIALLNRLEDTVTVSFDPGEIYARKGVQAIRSILERTDILLLNEREVTLLTNGDIRSGADSLLALGPHLVVVKMGDKGCYATDGRQHLHEDVLQRDVVDTTGAGDAFNAGFLYGYICQLPLWQCLQAGTFTAAECIIQVGARNGLPAQEDVTRFLDAIQPCSR